MSNNTVQNLFDKTLKLSIKNFNTNKSLGDNEDIARPKQFLKDLLEKGADINHAFKDIDVGDIYWLHSFKDLFLNSTKNTLSADTFLDFVLKVGIKKHGYSSIIDFKKIRIQKELVNEALDKGANLKKVLKNRVFDIEWIKFYKDLLLGHQKSSLTADAFLELLLISDLTRDDGIQNESVIIDRKAELLREFFSKLVLREVDIKKTLNLFPLIYSTDQDIYKLYHFIKNIVENQNSSKEILYECLSSIFSHLLPSKKIYSKSSDNFLLNDYIELAKTVHRKISDDGFIKDSIENELKKEFRGMSPEHQMYGVHKMLKKGLPDFVEMKYKNLYLSNNVDCVGQKIPSVLHHIWLTNFLTRREIKEIDIANLEKNMELFSTSKYDWKFIVWVNDRTLIPQSVEKLESIGVEVREIGVHLIKNIDLVNEHIAFDRWGMASDILRYDIISEYGGVYADINFRFNRVLDVEICNYDFMTMGYDNNGIYIDNFFFSARKNHPVVKKIQMFVEKNFSDDAPSFAKEFIESNYTDISKATDTMTAIPTLQGYYSAANQEGNVDVVYPYCAYYDQAILKKEGSPYYIHPNNEESPISIKILALNRNKYTVIEYFAGSGVQDIVKYVIKTTQDMFDSAVMEEQLVFQKNLKTLWEYEICPTELQCLGRDGQDGRSWVE